jgi:hypothetical protein
MVAVTALIPLNVPSRSTRQVTTFNLPISSTNYGLNEPLRHCMSIVNSDPSFSISQPNHVFSMIYLLSHL